MLSKLLNFSSKRLKVRKLQWDQIQDQLCLEMWQLRLNNTGLNPMISKQQDFEEFRNYFIDHCSTAITFWDKNNNLQGFYGCNVKNITFRDKNFQRVWVEYTYFNPDYRRRPEFNLSILLLGVKILWGGIGKRTFAVGVASPSSYIKLSSIKIFTFQSKDISEEHVHLLLQFLDEYGSYDPDKKVVKIRTLPHPVVIRNKKMEELMKEYEIFNPFWKDGYFLPLIFDGNISNFFLYLKNKFF